MNEKSLKNIKRVFLHQYVVIYLKDMQLMVPTEDGEGVTTNAAFDGFVVDIDEHGFYLGREEDGTITKIISHEVAAVVELMSETASNFEHLLEMAEEGEVH